MAMASADSALPRTILGFVVRFTGRHQIGLAVLSVAVFGLSAVPLELQRRIVNDAIKSGAVETIMWLAIAYAGVAVLEQVLKLCLNVYRGWVSEASVRMLRRVVQEECSPACEDDNGTRVSMMLSEAEPIGGFVGVSTSEPLLQVGILVSVIAYMAMLEPWMVVLAPASLLPQIVIVPLMQRAINRRAAARIKTLRDVSNGIVGDPVSPRTERARIERVFTLNMGIFKIKYSLNLFMNLMQYFAVAITLGVGGWFAVEGRVDVGTVVACVTGITKLKDPWGDIVNWARELSVVEVKYRLFSDAANRLAPEGRLVEAHAI
jgi:ABC-type bacteriocin/lantibiotic exporter with double-glycine peptidase domain